MAHRVLKSAKQKNISGPCVRAARLALNPPISQLDMTRLLAKKGIDLDPSAISRIESQERNIHDYELQAMADIVNATMDSLCPVIRAKAKSKAKVKAKTKAKR